MRFTVVLLVLLPCIAFAGFRSLLGSLLQKDGCNIPGGICKKSGENLSEDLTELVQWGLKTAAEQQNSLKGFNLKKVYSYSTQVVSGTNYEFDISVMNDQGEKRNVIFKIFDEPWSQTRELKIVKNVATATKNKDGCNTPGGVCKKTGETLSKNKQELVEWGIKTAAARDNSLQGFKLEKVNTYSSQVVAGMMYEFDIVVVNGGQKRNVVFKIFDQPWTKTRELTMVKNIALAEQADGCNLPGGVCKKTSETLSRRLQEVLDWGIKQASIQENSLQGFKLETVNSHSTQVVAGMNYVFDVTLVNGDKRRHVEIKVYDKSWTKARKLTILKNEAI